MLGLMGAILNLLHFSCIVWTFPATLCTQCLIPAQTQNLQQERSLRALVASVGGGSGSLCCQCPSGCPLPLRCSCCHCSSSKKQTGVQRGCLVSTLSKLRGLSANPVPAQTPDLQSSRKSGFLLRQQIPLSVSEEKV